MRALPGTPLPLLLLLLACATSTDSADTVTGAQIDSAEDTDTGPARPTDGAGLYTMFCSGCHGDDGKGLTGKGPDITAELDRKSDDQLIDIILNGQGRNEMPAIAVSEEEAQLIVDYLREAF